MKNTKNNEENIVPLFKKDYQNPKTGRIIVKNKDKFLLTSNRKIKDPQLRLLESLEYASQHSLDDEVAEYMENEDSFTPEDFARFKKTQNLTQAEQDAIDFFLENAEGGKHKNLINDKVKVDILPTDPLNEDLSGKNDATPTEETPKTE